MTKANPLLGLNRARTSKLRVLRPSPSDLFDALVLDGTPLQMPLVRKRPGPIAGETLALPGEEPAVSPWVVIPGDVDFDAAAER